MEQYLHICKGRKSIENQVGIDPKPEIILGWKIEGKKNVTVCFHYWPWTIHSIAWRSLVDSQETIWESNNIFQSDEEIFSKQMVGSLAADYLKSGN